MATGYVELTTTELSNIAYAVGLIMSHKAPGKIGLHPVSGFSCKVEFKPVGPGLTREDIDNYGVAGHSVWDTVLLDGQNCGNRSGGQTEFMKRLTEFLQTRKKEV